MPDAAELRAIREWLEAKRDRLNAEIVAIDGQIQLICCHEWRWRQVAGEGRVCPKCGKWDLDCDD